MKVLFNNEVNILLLLAIFSSNGSANSMLTTIFPDKELGIFHIGYNRLKGDEFNFRWSVASYTYSNDYVGLEFPTILVSSYNKDDGRDNYVSDNYLIALGGYSSIAFFRLSDKLMGTEAMYYLGDFLGTIALATTALPNTRVHLKYNEFPLSIYGGFNTQVFLEERTRFLYIVPKMADFLVTQESGVQYRFSNLKFKIFITKRLYNMTDLDVPSTFFGAEIYAFVNWISFLNRQ